MTLSFVGANWGSSVLLTQTPRYLKEILNYDIKAVSILIKFTNQKYIHDLSNECPNWNKMAALMRIKTPPTSLECCLKPNEPSVLGGALPAIVLPFMFVSVLGCSVCHNENND